MLYDFIKLLNIGDISCRGEKMVKNHDLQGLAQTTENSCLAITQRWLVEHRCICDGTSFSGPTFQEVDHVDFQGGSYHEMWGRLTNRGLSLPSGYERRELPIRDVNNLEPFIRENIKEGAPVATVIPVSGGYHSIVVVELQNGKVKYRNPNPQENTKLEEMTWERFSKLWDSGPDGTGREAVAIRKKTVEN